jgi:large subunit ribosomal protein L4
MKRTAIKQALSLKLEQLCVIEDFKKEISTKKMSQLLEKLGAKNRVLIITADKTIELTKSVNNLPNVKLVRAAYLSTADILDADQLIITKESLQYLTSWLSTKLDKTAVIK